jgi:ferritin-like metal-binding protein YciE
MDPYRLDWQRNQASAVEEGGNGTMTVKSAEDLFLWDLSEQRQVLQALAKVLPQRAQECTAEVQARDAFTDMERVTKQQAQRIEGWFQGYSGQPTQAQSAITRFLAEDHDTFFAQKPTPQAAILFDLGEADKMRSYTITAYNDLMEQAKTLDRTDVVKLLQENRTEDEAISRKTRDLSKRIRTQWAKQPASVGAAQR